MARAKTPRSNSGKQNGGAIATSVTKTSPQTFSEISEVPRALPDARKNIVPINLDEEIRRRAYELWEQHGCEPGHDKEHWLVAEREIRERFRAQHQQSA